MSKHSSLKRARFWHGAGAAPKQGGGAGRARRRARGAARRGGALASRRGQGRRRQGGRRRQEGGRQVQRSAAAADVLHRRCGARHGVRRDGRQAGRGGGARRGARGEQRTSCKSGCAAWQMAQIHARAPRTCEEAAGRSLVYPHRPAWMPATWRLVYKGSDSGRAQGEKRKALGFGGPVLNPAARKHSEAAAASLAPFGDSSGIGAKLLAQMGFGTAGSGLGRAGQVRRRRSRPLVSEERVVGCGRG